MSDPAASAAMRQQRAYDRASAIYAQQMTQTFTGLVNQRVRSSCIEALAVQPGDRVLDVGCGDGSIACLAAAQGAHVDGFDISPGMIALGNEYVAAHPDWSVRLYVDNAQTFTTTPEMYDAIVCANVLHRLTDPMAALRQMHSAVKPGGRLVLVTMNLTSPQFAAIWTYARIRALIGCPLSDTVVKHGFTRQRIRSLIAQAGFAVQALRSDVVVLPFLNVPYPKRYQQRLLRWDDYLSDCPGFSRRGVFWTITATRNSLEESGRFR